MHILLWSITKQCPPQAILVSDWPIKKNLLLWNRLAKSTETWQEASIWNVLYEDCSFRLDRLTNMATTGNFFSDWSISKNISPLKLPSQMNRNLVGSIYMYGRLFIKFPQSRMKIFFNNIAKTKIKALIVFYNKLVKIVKFWMKPGLLLLWNQREKWLLFQVLTKEKWETTGRSGESTGRSQNISLVVPLFTFAGHYRGIRML